MCSCQLAKQLVGQKTEKKVARCPQLADRLLPEVEAPCRPGLALRSPRPRSPQPSMAFWLFFFNVLYRCF